MQKRYQNPAIIRICSSDQHERKGIYIRISINVQAFCKVEPEEW